MKGSAGGHGSAAGQSREVTQIRAQPPCIPTSRLRHNLATVTHVTQIRARPPFFFPNTNLRQSHED
jgi:hypothetical protein